MSSDHGPRSTLIETKFRVPEARPDAIRRNRLLDELAGYAGPIVLVESPTGYGKSTLLQQWAEHDPRPVAFVCLDRSESDPVVFWRYVVAALGTVDPDLAVAAREELAGGAPLVDDVVVPQLLNALDRSGERLVLMLDDFHRVEGPAIAETLAPLIHRIPSSMTLAIATRPSHGLPLAILSDRGAILDVDESRLRFTLEETAAALRNFGASPSEHDVEAIHRATEGWATGVYLATRDGARPSRMAPQGTLHRYLITEMLDGFEIEDREFMQATSILDDLDPDLCDAVVEQTGSGLRLRRLAGSNILLTARDDAGHFRYHHLLQEVLQVELLATQGRAAAEVLHRRAYAWNVEHGRISEAIGHALSARAIDEAVELVCRSWYDYVWNGQCSTAQQWISWFDDADFVAYPPLAVAGAHVSAFAGDAGDAGEAGRLARLTPRLKYGGDPLDGSSTFEASVLIMLAFLGLDGPAAAVADAERALALEPETSSWRPALRAVHAVGRIFQADDRSLDDVLIEVASEPSGQLGIATYALGSLSLANAWRGRWPTAARIADEAIRQIEELHIGDLVTSGLPYAVSALAAARDGERARALHPLRLAEGAVERHGGGLPFDSMLLNMTVAETAIELDRTDLAVRHLSLAQAALATLGDGGRAERRLNRLVRRSERVVDTGSDADGRTEEPLTAREVQVLGLLSSGLTLEEVGERLFISRNTVKTHASRSYRKLNAHGHVEAVSKAERLGYL